MINRWMYHKDCKEGKIVNISEEEYAEMKKDGWVDIPSQLGQAEEVTEEEPITEPEVEETEELTTEEQPEPENVSVEHSVADSLIKSEKGLSMASFLSSMDKKEKDRLEMLPVYNVAFAELKSRYGERLAKNNKVWRLATGQSEG